jgi:predicted DNA-binding protein YlxM (UPF0122 family)
MKHKEIIEKYLKLRKMSVQELANSLNITQSAVYEMIKATDIKQSRIQELSLILDIPITEFFENYNETVNSRKKKGISLSLFEQVKRENEELKRDKDFLKRQIELKDMLLAK